MRYLFCYPLGEPWHLLTTLGVALVNNSEHENIHPTTCFGISHPKSPSLLSENKLAFPFGNQVEA